MHMEVRALFGRFIWRGINIYDVTIHPSRGSRINPTLKVCEHNRAAHASPETFETETPKNGSRDSITFKVTPITFVSNLAWSLLSVKQAKLSDIAKNCEVFRDIL